jgi:ATP-dependent 26S proteasome regulatory subunit
MNLPISSSLFAHGHPSATIPVELSPTQAIALERLRDTVRAVPVTVLTGGVGAGKTTLVNRLTEEFGGVRISCRDVLQAAEGANHPSYEEGVHRLVDAALDKADIVYVEDLDLFSFPNKFPMAYPRPYYLNTTLQALLETTRARGKRLVFTVTDRLKLVPQLDGRAVFLPLGALTPDDYSFFMERNLGTERARRLDARRIFSFASKLSVYQLNEVCALIRDDVAADDQTVLDLLDTRMLSSNVSLGEVAKVDFSNLKGFEEIAEKLQTFIVNPWLFDSRFADLNLMPKKGILLYGPPGTGKTSVGRALAHRMKGKFFMVDGTIFSESPDAFYNKVRAVFDQAKLCTPSVIFIDDADVLMQSERVHGLNRYLLTMLDGLETETAGKVAVILTAMDPNQMPAALLRAGRVELWLETKLPDARARQEILDSNLAKLPERLGAYDAERVKAATEGFNAADISRVVADVKALYAADVIRDIKPATLDSYFDRAAAEIRRTKELIASAQAGTLETSEPRGNFYGTKPRKRADQPVV